MIYYYDEEVKRILSDPKTYRTLVSEQAAKDIAADFITKVESLLKKHSKMFEKYEVKFITRRFHGSSTSDQDTGFVFPEFYIMVKGHKNPWRGRPIVPNFKTVSADLSKWLSIKLQPVVNSLDGVLKDTPSLVRTLEEFQPPADCEIAAADVEQLYPSIPTKYGVQVVRYVLKKKSHFNLSFIALLCALLTLVLTTNVFQYAGQFLLQIQGTAMVHLWLQSWPTFSCGV